jgi:hypothetical protein
MAKRFGDTDIWKKQRWFRKLIPEYKLAFLYIKDQCDHAGIWNIECTDLMEDLGIETFNLADFVTACNTEYDKNTGKSTFKERLRVLDKGYIWVTGFIQFQYKGKEGLVNPYAAPVKTALQILSGFQLLKEALNGSGFITLTEGLPEGYLTPKDKDKDKDKYRKEGVGGKQNKQLKGVRFSEDGSEVFFEDGSSQELGLGQQQRYKEGDYKPHYITKGKIE